MKQYIINEKVISYLFVDLATGEEFIVEITTSRYTDDEYVANKMERIAKKYFEEPDFLEILTEEEADRLGLDTYTE